MPTFAEVTTWTNPEIVEKIRALLPQGWTFDHALEETGAFIGKIVDPESGFVQWEDVQADEHLLLLNAYGWVFTRKPTVRHPAWVRGATPGIPISKQGLPAVADPEDLDPAEVESVYEAPKPGTSEG